MKSPLPLATAEPDFDQPQLSVEVQESALTTTTSTLIHDEVDCISSSETLHRDLLAGARQTGHIDIVILTQLAFGRVGRIGSAGVRPHSQLEVVEAYAYAREAQIESIAHPLVGLALAINV